MNNYVPPFTITNKMLDYISNIMEKIGRLNHFHNLGKMPLLRRNNRITSIHASLAIEANSLSLRQVKDVINGKYVVGPEREIQEVKNAYASYEMIHEVEPYSIELLKRVHEKMMCLLVDDAGKFRDCAEGVFDGERCIFMAPPADMVPILMEQLFDWMVSNKDELHPLILSSVFHYEFLFVHPFSDGNGRMARLWQNVILSKWKEIFEYVPLESRIKEYQEEYYQVIANSHKNGNSNEFIEFMLRMIDEVFDKLLVDADLHLKHQSVCLNKLMDVMEYDVPMTASEIMEKLGIKSKETFRKNYIDPAIESGVVERTVPDKATSKNQRYYKV